MTSGAEPTVLHVAPTLGAADGISTATLNMVLSYQRHGVRAGLLTASYPGASVHADLRHLADTTVLPVHGAKALARYPSGFIRTLAQLGREFDLVHIHGLWRYPSLVGGPLLRIMRVPYVLSPHGLLMTEALSRHSLRKSLAYRVIEKATLRGAQLLMADGVREAEALSRLVPQLRCALVPLAVDTESFRPDEGRGRDGITRKQLLTVSRLHPIKRLVELVQAFARVSSRHSTWDLVIAGPNEDSAYRRRIEVTAASLRIADQVRLVGPLEGDRLVGRYREARVFVLASASESAGLTIVEALAVGLPVVATTGTPWKELVDAQCGWWVDPGVDALADGLDEAMSASDEMLLEMGRRARRLAVARYSLDALRDRLTRAYADAIAQRTETTRQAR